jgi:hypothetical protein
VHDPALVQLARRADEILVDRAGVEHLIVVADVADARRGR